MVVQTLLFALCTFICGVAVGMWWAGHFIHKRLLDPTRQSYTVAPGQYVPIQCPQPTSATPVKDWLNEVSPEETFRESSGRSR
jgi:hypothetical protein